MAILQLCNKANYNGVYYEVDTGSQPIGEGGMGMVYAGRCINTVTGMVRPVAIKVIRMGLSSEVIERARRESHVRLRNENLVEMLDFIETDEVCHDGSVVKRYYVISELLNGVTLANLLNGKVSDRHGREVAYARMLLNESYRSSEHFARTIIRAVLSGLTALHDAGYVHRDIDPSNIIITEDGKIKLIDFGICKPMNNITVIDNAFTVANTFMGKPEYASPELCLGDVSNHNQTTDIYAVGILLFQCITGHVPFEGPRYQVIEQQIKEKLPLKAIKDKNLRHIIGKACEKRQAKRYRTTSEMRVDLDFLNVKRPFEPYQRNVLVMVGMVVLLCAVASFAGYSFYKAGYFFNKNEITASSSSAIKSVNSTKPTATGDTVDINPEVKPEKSGNDTNDNMVKEPESKSIAKADDSHKNVDYPEPKVRKTEPRPAVNHNNGKADVLPKAESESAKAIRLNNVEIMSALNQAKSILSTLDNYIKDKGRKGETPQKNRDGSVNPDWKAVKDAREALVKDASKKIKLAVDKSKENVKHASGNKDKERIDKTKKINSSLDQIYNYITQNAGIMLLPDKEKGYTTKAGQEAINKCIRDIDKVIKAVE